MLGLAISPVKAQQQGGCPGGLVPASTGACVSQAEANHLQAEGAATPTSRYSGPLWQDRFGAIAVDSKTGSIGWASGVRSKKETYKAAIEDCGGCGCEVKSWVRNDCVATTWGGG